MTIIKDGPVSPDTAWAVTDATYDMAIRLVAYRPDGARLGVLPDASNIRVTYGLSEIGALVFEYNKESSNAEWFLRAEGLEIATELYTPSVGGWREPINGRFLVLDWEDDVVDDRNILTVTCSSYGWLLSKVTVHKRKQDDKLRIAEEKAEEKAGEAKSDYESAQRDFNNVMTSTRTQYKLNGGTYVLKYIPKTVNGKVPKVGSLLFHTVNRKLYFKHSSGQWRTLTSDSDRHQEAREAYDEMTQALTKYGPMKNTYERAKKAAAEATKAHRRPMLKVTAGAVMNRLFQEVRQPGRTRVPGMKITFNGTYSSGFANTWAPGNQPGTRRLRWNRRFDLELSIGQSYLDVLNSLTEMGEVEWFFYKRELRMYRPGDLGVKLGGYVALMPGHDMVEAPDRASRRDFANYLHVRGEEHTSFGMWPAERDKPIGWGTWETSVAISGVEGRTALKAAALKEAQNSLKRIKVESTRQLALGSYADYRPMYDYLPGQYINAYASNGVMQSYRVVSISLVYDESTGITGAITLGDKFYQAALNFRKTIARTVGGYEKVIGGGTVPQLPAPPVPPAQKYQGPIPVVAASVRAGVNKLTGQPASILTLTWQYESDPENAEPVSAQEATDAEQEATP